VPIMFRCGRGGGVPTPARAQRRRCARWSDVPSCPG
jgi:hypothetical protein